MSKIELMQYKIFLQSMEELTKIVDFHSEIDVKIANVQAQIVPLR
jgi:hypothetical protein